MKGLIEVGPLADVEAAAGAVALDCSVLFLVEPREDTNVDNWHPLVDERLPMFACDMEFNAFLKLRVATQSGRLNSLHFSASMVIAKR